MEVDAKEKTFDKQMWLNSLKISAKILLACLVLFFYIISVLFFLAPNIDAKLFNFFGLTKAEESCYLQVYDNSGKITDLYNIVLFEQENGNYEKEIYYINVLMSDDEYESFCEKMNKASIKSSSKELYAYVGDVNAYLINRKVKCLYALNLENSYENRSSAIIAYVRNQLKSENAYETSFLTYVNLVLNDKTLTDSQIKETFEILDGLISSEDSESTTELLQKREDLILLLLEEESDNVQKIILQKSLVDFYKAEYRYFDVLGEEESVLDEIENSYNQAVLEYQNLIK